MTRHVRRSLLSLGAMLVVLLFLASRSPAQALPTPALQLPWEAGNSHRIFGGNTYGCDTHQGSNGKAIDFQFTIGEIVAAVTHGTVLTAVSNNQSNGGAGNYMAIDHGNGYESRYLHLRVHDPTANPPTYAFPSGIGVGSFVSMGQAIAYSGDTGGVEPHLHYDLKLNGNAFLSEPMSGFGGFGFYGYSQESGIGANGCLLPNSPGCTPTTCGPINDPSPYWLAGHDSDGDGYRDSYEPNIGTDPSIRCGVFDTTGPSEHWPSDTVEGAFSANKLNVADLGSFTNPIRRLGTKPGNANFSPRWDLRPAAPIGQTGPWIGLVDMAVLITGTTGYPPMFGGAKAFGGQVCTD